MKGIELNYEVYDDIKLILEQELRINEDISSFKQYLTNAGLKYRINSIFKIAAFYRHKIRKDDIENSFYINGYARYKLKPLEFSYRLRYHKKFPQKEDSEDYFRNRLKVEYKLNKMFSPFIAGEYFYHAFYDKGDRFDKMRYYIGFSITPFKRHKFNIHYMHQQGLFHMFPSMQNLMNHR